MAKRTSALARTGVCLTICNHWSYIGIGWQLGIESCMLSVLDGMETADRKPGARTCINHDARAYEFLAEKFPEVIERLKRYLRQGKVELIGGSYGQPLGTMYSGESNIRQLVVGREVIRRSLGYEVETFLEQEEFSHPQMPQIIAGAGFRYASLCQVDTWGRAGCPSLQVNVFQWKGLDGTTMPCTPKNAGYYFGMVDKDRIPLDTPEFLALARDGKPLIFSWEEFGWESVEDPAYGHAPAKYQAFADRVSTEFVTLGQYMRRYGGGRKRTVRFQMDQWDKQLSWGLGGDQLRVLDRKVEVLLHAAERFDYVAAGLGASSRVAALDAGWRDLLASQSHDVSLCEYSRWQGGRMAVFDRIEDKHNFTWGAIGYQHLDAAQRAGQKVLDACLHHIGTKIPATQGRPGDHRLLVFNPEQWSRSGVVSTGVLHAMPAGTRTVEVLDAQGKVRPCQVLRHDVDERGQWTAADVAVLTGTVPGVGYDSYTLRFGRRPRRAPRTDLRVSRRQLTMENRHMRLRLDPDTGAVRSLVDRRSGRELLDAAGPGWPIVRGIGDPRALPVDAWKRWFPNHPDPNVPVQFDTAQSKANLTWLAEGPLLATLRAQHENPYVRVETRVTLRADCPWAEVVTRLLLIVPPLLDDVSGGRWPKHVPILTHGYWLDFQPALRPATILRDYPLGVEPAAKEAFHALTFVDLCAHDAGLLILHNGTQYFRRQPEGTLRNLLVREWESHYSAEYGWPRYCEYHHALMPHRGHLSNSDRLRASSQFASDMITRVSQAHARPTAKAALPNRRSFLHVPDQGVQLLAMRAKPDGAGEIRLLECEGKSGRARLTTPSAIATAHQTDLLGRHTGAVTHRGASLDLRLKPWRVHTVEVRRD